MVAQDTSWESSESPMVEQDGAYDTALLECSRITITLCMALSLGDAIRAAAHESLDTGWVRLTCEVPTRG